MESSSNLDEDIVTKLSNTWTAICNKRLEDTTTEDFESDVLDANIVDKIIETLADMSNYAMMQFIKLALLQNQLQEPEPETMGVGGFKQTGP